MNRGCTEGKSVARRRTPFNVAVMHAFVGLCRLLATNKILARKLAELERRLEVHDQAIKSLFKAIRQLMSPPAKPRHEIGFHAVGKAATNAGEAKTRRQ